MYTTLSPEILLRSIIGVDPYLRNAPAQQGFPHYNIERKGDDLYRLTLAVAGFAETDLDVEVADGMLSIRGRHPEKTEEADFQFMHQGIALREFERSFKLDAYVEVSGARMVNGLLIIDLARILPESLRPKKIAIGGEGVPQVVEAPPQKLQRLRG